ncbi:MAG: glycine zipper 2TM domain-containing protein [Chromatiales bacterium]|jgi:uncharacterized protein YcfJ
MNIKHAAAALGLGAILSAGSGAAGANGDFYAQARVLATEPLYQTVTVNRPEERCWNEQVYRRGPRGSHYSYTPTITGGIIGGLIGNQLGHGSGRPWATAAGALLGGSIGRDAYARSGPSGPGGYTTERRCDLVDRYEDRQELVGYRVKYVYDGETFWTETRENPGDWIRVRVGVDAVEDGYARYDGGPRGHGYGDPWDL